MSDGAAILFGVVLLTILVAGVLSLLGTSIQEVKDTLCGGVVYIVASVVVFLVIGVGLASLGD